MKVQKLLFIISIISLSYTSTANALTSCRSLKNAYGPFDYTSEVHFKEKLPIVEKHHFVPEIEMVQKGIKGKKGGHIDLDYTLRAFPNHAPALHEMVRQEIKGMKNSKTHPVECYLSRAIRIQPNDTAVYIIWGIYDHSKKNYRLAVNKFLKANELSPNNAEVHYNLGLSYFELKEFEKSKSEAQKAYALGFPLMGLKRKLIRAKKWNK